MTRQQQIRRFAMLAASGIIIALAWSLWPSPPPQPFWKLEQDRAGQWTSALGIGPTTSLSTSDRCIACHVNIARPEFSRRAEIAWLEKQGCSVPNFWETWAAKLSPASIVTAHQMRRPIMDQLMDDLPAQTGQMLAEQYRVGLIADRAAKGLGQLDPSPALLGHPPIPPHHLDCTACHEGSGDATDFFTAGHTPRQMMVDASSGAPIVPEELTSTGYVDTVTGTPGTAISQADYWEKTYPSGQTAHPMLRLSHIEADCVRCHTNTYDIQPAAPTLCEGRRLFNTLGCADCHTTARKVGPDLRHLDSKLTPDAVADWIVHPRGQMPPIGIGADEARTITDYLFAHSTQLSLPPLLPLPAGITGDPARGKMLFAGHHLDDPQALSRHLPVGLKAGIGCIACHSITPDAPQTFGPNLSQIMLPSQQWLFTWLKDPRQCDPNALMPNMRLTDQEAMDLSSFLLFQKRTISPPADASQTAAPALIAHYGCAQCHAIDGVAPQPPVDLADRIIMRETSTGIGPGREDRIAEILSHPDPTPLPLTKQQMPHFTLTEAQVDALVTFIMSKVSPPLENASDDLSSDISRGREITETYNCTGCHQTELDRPAVQKYFSYAWIGNYAPPSLYDEGSRVQPDWLAGFLRQVRPIRPQVAMRMPSFSFGDGEVKAMGDYFRAIDVRQSRDLRAAMKDHDALIVWALRTGEVKQVQLNPALNTPVELDQTMQEILYKAKFIAAMEESRGSSSAPITPDRYALGAQFVAALQCYQCHSFYPGHPDARGPAFVDIAHRLNRNWVRAWLAESTIIQPDTAMPPVFAAGHRKELQPDLFGKTADEQSDLLLDFLYAAGSK